MTTDTGQQTLYDSALARIADADAFGVASVEETRGTPLYDSAIALLPGARSIAVVAMEIFQEVADLVVAEGRIGEAAARDLYGPHLDYLNGRLNRAVYDVAKVYRGAGYLAIPMPSLGTPNDRRYMRGILSFKHAAEYAGLGTIGRSSLLVTPKFGPRVRLACLLTDAPMPAGQRLGDDPCSSCPGLCVEHCPAGALAMPKGAEPYSMNKFACSVYRDAAGGCNSCLSSCPIGC